MCHGKPVWKIPRVASLFFCASLVSLPSPATARGAIPAESQTAGQAEPGPGQTDQDAFGGQPPVGGIVTAIAGDHATVKTQTGDLYQVFLGPNTRLMRERQPAKIADIQVGDMLTAMGEVDAAARTIHAAVAMDVSAEQVKKLREGLGKEWIAGRVTAINDTTLTIHRIDNATQKIEVDETTSFRKRSGRLGTGGAAGMGAGGVAGSQGAPPVDPAASGESITLADIKLGDNVTGRGGMKGDVFVPTVLAVRSPPPGGSRRRVNPSGPDAATPTGTR